MSVANLGTTRAPQIDMRFYSFADGTASTFRYDLKRPDQFKNIVSRGLVEDIRVLNQAASPDFQPVKFSPAGESLTAISSQLDLSKPVRLLVIAGGGVETTLIEGYLRLPSTDDLAMLAIEGRSFRVSLRTNDGPKVADPFSILAAYGTPKK